MNKITKNVFWIVGCKIIKMVLTLVVTMITARYLGPANYGLISYASGLVAFALPIMKLGIDAIMVYEFVQFPNESGKIIGTAIVMNFFSAIICLLGITVFVNVVNAGEKDTIIVCFLYSLILIFQAFEMIQYWFQAKLLSKYSSIIMVVSYFVLSLVQILILLLKLNIYIFAISYSIEYIIINILLLLIYKKINNSSIKFSMSICKRLFSKGKYYIVSSMMVTIFAQTDKIMLKLMNNNDAVGYYSAGVTCAGMISFVFAAIIDSMRSTIFESKKISKEKFETKMIILYSIIIYGSAIVSIVICLFAPIIVNILYGKQFDQSISVLRIIVWYTTFSYLGTIRNIWILSENKQKYLWIINLAGALLNIIINLIMIPLWGIIGAAIASLITQIFTNVIVGYIIKPIRENNKLMKKACNPKIIKEFLFQTFSISLHKN